MLLSCFWANKVIHDLRIITFCVIHRVDVAPVEEKVIHGARGVRVEWSLADPRPISLLVEQETPALQLRFGWSCSAKGVGPEHKIPRNVRSIPEFPLV